MDVYNSQVENSTRGIHARAALHRFAPPHPFGVTLPWPGAIAWRLWL